MMVPKMMQLLTKAILLVVLWNWCTANADATGEVGSCPLVHTKSYLTVAVQSQGNGQPQSSSSTPTPSTNHNSFYHLSLLNFQHHQNPFEKVFLHMKVNENTWKTTMLTSALPPTESYGGMFSDPFELAPGDVIHFYATYEIKGKQCDTEILLASIPTNEDNETPNDSKNAPQYSQNSKPMQAPAESTHSASSISHQHKAMDELAKEESMLHIDEGNSQQNQYAPAYHYYHPYTHQSAQNQMDLNGIDPAQHYQYVDPAAYYNQYYYQSHNQDHANDQAYAYYYQQMQGQQQPHQYAHPEQQGHYQTDPSQGQQNEKSAHSNAHSICNSLTLNYTHQSMEFAPSNTYILTFSSPTPLPIDTIDVHSRLNANEIQHERIAADVSASHIQRVQHVVTVNKGDILSYYWSFHSTDDEGTLTECQTEVMTIDNRLASL